MTKEERIEETAQRLHPAIGWERYEPKGRHPDGSPAPVGLRCRHELTDGRVVAAGVEPAEGWFGWVISRPGAEVHIEADCDTPADFRAVLAACSGAVLDAIGEQEDAPRSDSFQIIDGEVFRLVPVNMTAEDLIARASGLAVLADGPHGHAREWSTTGDAFRSLVADIAGVDADGMSTDALWDAAWAQAKCDGDHRAPACQDRKCWKRSPIGIAGWVSEGITGPIDLKFSNADGSRWFFGTVDFELTPRRIRILAQVLSELGDDDLGDVTNVVTPAFVRRGGLEEDAGPPEPAAPPKAEQDAEHFAKMAAGDSTTGGGRAKWCAEGLKV